MIHPNTLRTNREENFDATEELRYLTKNNGATTSGSEEKVEHSLTQAQNLLRSMIQDMERDLELNQISSWATLLITNKI